MESQENYLATQMQSGMVIRYAAAKVEPLYPDQFPSLFLFFHTTLPLLHTGRTILWLLRSSISPYILM